MVLFGVPSGMPWHIVFSYICLDIVGVHATRKTCLRRPGVQHRKRLIAKLAQLRPGCDDRWRAIRKELRALRKGGGFGREQRRTVELLRTCPGKIRESNAGQRECQHSRQAHTAWTREKTIHRRGEQVEKKDARLEHRSRFASGPNAQILQGFTAACRVGGTNRKGSPKGARSACPPCGSVNTPHGTSTRTARSATTMGSLATASIQPEQLVCQVPWH